MFHTAWCLVIQKRFKNKTAYNLALVWRTTILSVMATPAANPFFSVSFVRALGLTWTRMKNWLVSRATRHGSRLGWTDSCTSWTDWVVARGKSSSGMTGQPYARSNTSRNTDALSVSCTVARSCCRPRCSAGDPPANTAQLSNSIHNYSEKIFPQQYIV